MLQEFFYCVAGGLPSHIRIDVIPVKVLSKSIHPVVPVVNAVWI